MIGALDIRETGIVLELLQPFMCEGQLDVDALEAALLAQEQAPCPVTHHFGPGVYIREIFMPAGAIVVGACHRYESHNEMLQGKLALFMDGGFSVVEAPFMAVAQPGRKVAYVIEDTVWRNIHATEERDLDKLEAMFIEKTPRQVERLKVAA